jgi:membrane glycosyltransferase
MPVQRLDGNPPAAIEVKTRPHGMMVKRLLLVLLTAVLALGASSECAWPFPATGWTVRGAAAGLLCAAVQLGGLRLCGLAIGFMKLISGEHPGFTALPAPPPACASAPRC